MSSSPFTVAEHLIDASYIREYPHATTTQEAPLKLAVKKYTPVDNPNPRPGDITLVAVPGSGLPKVSIMEREFGCPPVMLNRNHNH